MATTSIGSTASSVWHWLTGGNASGQGEPFDSGGGGVGGELSNTVSGIAKGASDAGGALLSGLAADLESTFQPFFADISRVLLYLGFLGAGLVLVLLGFFRLTGVHAAPVPIPV